MHIIVTGAAGVLGQSVVEHLEQAGHQVSAFVSHASSGAATQYAADLRDPQTARDAVNAATRDHGPVDALVHLVGAFNWIPIADSTIDDWMSLYAINVGTTINMVHAVTPHMPDGGAIVCVGAASAQPAGAGMAPYGAAKSGVARVVEALSQELRERHIRVNAVAPAIIDTPRNRTDMPDADYGAWTTPAAIAETIAFLTSPASRAINGAVVPVTNAA